MSIQIPSQSAPIQGPDSQLLTKAWYIPLAMLVQRVNGLFNAGGDLSGTLPDPSVVALQGNAVSDAAPADGDILTWVDADQKWEPKAGGAAAWTTYTPSTTNLSSTSKDAAYSLSGKTCSVNVKVVGTSNGTNPTISLPFTANDANRVTFACYISTGGATVAGVVVCSGATVTLSLYDNAALGGATVYTFVFSGAYETT